MINLGDRVRGEIERFRAERWYCAAVELREEDSISYVVEEGLRLKDPSF